MNSEQREIAVLSDITLTYPGPPDVRALKDVNISIRAGEFLTIQGPSGSGKSTLLNVLGMLDRPTSGRFRLSGIDVGELSDDDRASIRGQRIGFVFQAFHLLKDRSAVENVQLSLLYSGSQRELRRQRAELALRRVGLGHRFEAPPARLSGGERQRVAVARAIVNEPSFLLCDEPTGNLDSRTAASILDLLVSLNQAGQSVVVITHDDRIARLGQRRFEMVDGELTQLHGVSQ